MMDKKRSVSRSDKTVTATRRKDFGPGDILVEVKPRHSLTFLKGTCCQVLLKTIKAELGCNGHVVERGVHAPSLAIHGGVDMGKRLVAWLKSTARWSTAKTYIPIPALDLTVACGAVLQLDSV